ncbi:MAG: DUF4142 domain-containing protein [Pseudomonadota bacterium]
MLNKNLPKVLLGASALALLFGSVAVQAQSTATPTTDDRAPITGQGAQTPATGQGTPTPAAGQQGMQTPPTSGSMGATTQGSSAQAATESGATQSATEGSTTRQAATGTMRAADQRLLKEIAQGNIAEIETAKLAQAKSQNEQVKNYAQQMIDDHTRVLTEVQQLAAAKGVTLPTEMDRKHKKLSDRMNAMTGEQFDRAYMSNAGLNDHKKMHQLLSRTETRAADPDLKALAAKTRPAVEQHLHSAQQMRGSSTKQATESGNK